MTPLLPPCATGQTLKGEGLTQKPNSDQGGAANAVLKASNDRFPTGTTERAGNSHRYSLIF